MHQGEQHRARYRCTAPAFLPCCRHSICQYWCDQGWTGLLASLMSRVNCLYCGEAIEDDLDRCPHCGGISHYQKKGFRFGTQKKFVIWFVLLVVVCLAAVFWLPR